MKKLFCSACLTALLLAVVTPCFAASPWDGTWKLNEAKSKMTGDVFTLTALHNGGFHLSEDNGSFQLDYTCDGKDYVVNDKRTGNCVKVDDHHYKMAGKLNGQPAWQGTSVVSDDNKFLTNSATERRPDGTSSTVTNKFERIGPGTGRAGTWKNVKASGDVTELMKLTLTGDTLRLDDLAYKSVMIAKLDGSPAHLEGPDVPKGFEMRVKSEGPLKVHLTTYYNGKQSSDGFQAVSADGKVLTYTTWDPGKPANKQTYIYEKL